MFDTDTCVGWSAALGPFDGSARPSALLPRQGTLPHPPAPPATPPRHSALDPFDGTARSSVRPPRQGNIPQPTSPARNEHRRFCAPEVKRRVLTPTLSAARDASTPLRRRLAPPGDWYDPPRACRDPGRSSRPVVGASARPSACVSQCGECHCCCRKHKIPAGPNAGARAAERTRPPRRTETPHRRVRACCLGRGCSGIGPAPAMRGVAS